MGNLDAARDWGYSKPYVKAMWLMLQQGEPDDYIFAPGESHAVHEFFGEAFNYVDLDGHELVVIDPKYYRPAEVDLLLGDASKAKQMLVWEPTTRFKDLVGVLMDADIASAEQEKRSL